MDRFKLPDTPTIALRCEECGYEIYKDELYLDIEGTVICYDQGCILKHALKVLNITRKFA